MARTCVFLEQFGVPTCPTRANWTLEGGAITTARRGHYDNVIIVRYNHWHQLMPSQTAKRLNRSSSPPGILNLDESFIIKRDFLRLINPFRPLANKFYKIDIWARFCVSEKPDENLSRYLLVTLTHIPFLSLPIL